MAEALVGVSLKQRHDTAKRLAKHLQFQSSYTWSKSIDYTSLNSPGGLYPNGGVTVQDSNNIREDRGLSDYDARHRFVFSGFYELPFQVPENLILLGRCLGILSGICTGLDPDFNVWTSVVPYTQKLVEAEGENQS